MKDTLRDTSPDTAKATSRPVIRGLKIFQGKSAVEAYMSLNSGLKGVLENPQAQYLKATQAHQEKEQLKKQPKIVPDIGYDRPKPDPYKNR